MNMQEGKVSVCRLPIHYLDWPLKAGRASRNAPPLFLLHGFLSHAWSFVPFVQSFLKQAAARGAPPRRIVAINLRGHGDSGWVQGGYYHFPDYLLDVTGVADALEEERFSLLGHSMGGMAACLVAGTFPERIAQLILLEGLGPQAMTPDAAPERFRQWVNDVRAVQRRSGRGIDNLDAATESLRRMSPALPSEILRDIARHGTRERPDGRLEWKSDPLHRTQSPQPFYFEQAAAFWRKVASPVLFVSGSESRFREFDFSDRTRCFSDVRSVVIEGAGHDIHQDQPEKLGEAVLDFLMEEPKR